LREIGGCRGLFLGGFSWFFHSFSRGGGLARSLFFFLPLSVFLTPADKTAPHPPHPPNNQITNNRSFIDNWEWKEGFGTDFGIVDVDFRNATLPRTPKDSARWLRTYIFPYAPA
jgi:hypothetical protein